MHKQQHVSTAVDGNCRFLHSRRRGAQASTAKQGVLHTQTCMHAAGVAQLKIKMHNDSCSSLLKKAQLPATEKQRQLADAAKSKQTKPIQAAAVLSHLDTATPQGHASWKSATRITKSRSSSAFNHRTKHSWPFLHAP